MVPESATAKIAAQEAEVVRLRRELELAEAVLRGMRAILPEQRSSAGSDEIWNKAAPILSEASNAERMKGRQKGAISHPWRDALHILHMNYRDGFSEFNASAAANAAGLPNVRPKDALERLRAYLPLNYVEVVGGKFRVTDFAVQKYGFDRPRMEAPSTEEEEAP